jgi:hypothetical protein
MQGSKGVSRRNFLEGCACGLAVAGTTAVPALAELPTTEIAYNRMIKAAAHYQNRPNGKQHCAICRHFQAPNSCEIVIGRISPHGWCRFFSAGQGATGSSGSSGY